MSLFSLGTVIHSLSTNAKHIPYNDSKLTKILQSSLGGNFKTTLIVACSPHNLNAEETITSLQFATRAKKIKNKVKANIIRSNEELEKIIEKLRAELDFVKKELNKYKNFYNSVKDIKGDDMEKIDLFNLSLNDSKENADENETEADRGKE